MNDSHIKTWRAFTRIIRPQGCKLLSRLDDYPESVLVAGCQRSGTTVLSRVITNSEGFVGYKITKDDELDAALILSGYKKINASGRFCFQTTYLNECYSEYFSMNSQHKIVWVIRNPFSVVYSLLYNWTRAPLNNLFNGCALSMLTDAEITMHKLSFGISVSRLKKAVLSYVAKSEQAIELAEKIDPSRFLIIDYQDLVCNKENSLPLIYDFIGHNYNEKYKDYIHSQSLNKASRLNKKELNYIGLHCLPIYEATKKLAARI